MIYLAEEADGQRSVIDGQQRLTSFFNFLDGKFPLTGMRERLDLNRKHFTDLEKALQRKTRDASLRVVTIKNESDPDLKFGIFERLNSGSVALNEQELRNCVFRGNYNRLLKDLATDPDFMFIVGFHEPDPRMRDIELVLSTTAAL